MWQESPLANALGVSAGTAASTKWFKTLEGTVGDGYVTVATRSMYQNHLWVSTKREHASKITGVETYQVRALHFPLAHSFSHTNLKSPRAEQAEQGIGKVWGNKGGTGESTALSLSHSFSHTNLKFPCAEQRWRCALTATGWRL